MDKAKKQGRNGAGDGQPMHELWGVVFMAIGLLVVISLVSHFVNGQDNILGPWLGRSLSRGLVILFGPAAAFFFPLAVILAGFRLFRGSPIYYNSFIWGVIITVELCVLLAIHNLPTIRSESFALSSNVIGNFFVYYPLFSVFRAHRFGPYFLFSFALLITAALAAEINIRHALAVFWRFVKAVALWIARGVKNARGRLFAKKPAPIPEPAAPGRKRVQAADASPQIAAAVQAALPDADAETEGVDSGMEDEARKLLEEQLAEFRRKRHEPIKIGVSDEEETGEEEGSGDNGEQDKDGKPVRGKKRGKRTAPPDGEEGGEEGGEGSGEGQEDAAGEAPDQDGDEPEGEETSESEEAMLDRALDDDVLSDDYYRVPSVHDQEVKPPKTYLPYQVPSPDILSDPLSISTQFDREMFEANSHTLEKTLLNFGIEGKVVHVSPGPVVTRYEVELAPGIKISKVVSLHDDLSLAVGGKKIRIEAPIPGKAAVGIELPNDEMQLVHFKHVLLSDAFTKSKAKLPIVIGRAISGAPFVADITKMPHLLIAGQTGSGKSVCINSIICSMLMTKTPDELRLILVDPKKVELSYFGGIPHLLAPVVTESKEAVKALQWAVMEMTRRYKMLARAGARNIDSFNRKVSEGGLREEMLSEVNNKQLPFIVVIVDELADLMLTSRGDVESLIQRIAQLARAVGIHLIVATQRPSTDIITGPIKANLASRIAFRTISFIDSRTIIDTKGAEKLLGRGDMLFLRSGAPDIERYHGSFISEEDVERVVEAIRDQEVDVAKIDSFGGDDDGTGAGEGGGDGAGSGERDEKFAEAARLVVGVKQGSTSLLQRHLKLGFARAGRLMDQLEKAGIVGPSEGSKAREVLVSVEELEEILREMGEV